MNVTQIVIGKMTHTRWEFATRAEAVAWAAGKRRGGERMGRVRRLPDGRYAYGSRAVDENDQPDP